MNPPGGQPRSQRLKNDQIWNLNVGYWRLHYLGLADIMYKILRSTFLLHMQFHTVNAAFDLRV
jgi:hypothetical protein